MKFADLHLHTVFSDSTYTPRELINLAGDLDIAIVAVTDHDTVEGIAPTIEAAKDKDIEVIPAIELTAEHQGREIHILGYFIEYGNKTLIKELAVLKENRLERLSKMLHKLKEMNVNIKAEQVLKISGAGTVGRLHLARTLVAEGFVNSIYEAFGKYIGEHSPAYVCGFRFNPAEAIKLIRDYGGIAVLAHPYILKKDDLISLFVEQGLRGLEAYYPEHSKAMTRHYKDLADKYGLLVTGGSDCHGSAKAEAQLGSIKLPIDFVEKLRQEKEKDK